MVSVHNVWTAKFSAIEGGKKNPVWITTTLSFPSNGTCDHNGMFLKDNLVHHMLSDLIAFPLMNIRSMAQF